MCLRWICFDAVLLLLFRCSAFTVLLGFYFAVLLGFYFAGGANYGQPLSLTVLGRTWYCKTIWSLCWLHEQLIAMFLLLSLWFCFIAVNILVDHEELELAYDANIYTIRFTVTIHNSQRGSQSQFTVTYSWSQCQYQVFTVIMSQFTVTVTIHSQSQFTIHSLILSVHSHNSQSQSQFTVTISSHSHNSQFTVTVIMIHKVAAFFIC